MFLEGSISNRLYTALYTPGAEYDDDVVWRGLPGAGLVAMSAAFSRSPWSPVRRAQAQSDGAWVEAYELLSERVTALERRLDTTANAVEPAVAASRPTGLVVDARGSNFIPSLSPNIRRLRGAIVYPNPAAQKSLMGSGRLVALFARDVDFALAHPRVGERPLLVKGLRTWGDTRSEIVLGQEAAETVAELATSSFFDDAGVIIVLD